ncbi:ATP-binding protein [[Mycoplasma] cavipharyngis]|uniref:VirB4 family type IV secretion system protein n=1 Tax=[Mycoplasma] cavipharyngis TaxID=92757 RepID=UPI003704BF36
MRRNLVIKNLSVYKRLYANFQTYEYFIILVYLGIGFITGMLGTPEKWDLAIKVLISIILIAMMGITFIPLKKHNARLHTIFFRWIRFQISPKINNDPKYIIPYEKLVDENTIATFSSFGVGTERISSRIYIQAINIDGRDLNLEDQVKQSLILESLKNFFVNNEGNYSLVKIVEPKNFLKGIESIIKKYKMVKPTNSQVNDFWKAKIDFWKNYGDHQEDFKAGFYLFIYDTNLNNLNTKTSNAIYLLSNMGNKIKKCTALKIVNVLSRLINPNPFKEEIKQDELEANKNNLNVLLAPSNIVWNHNKYIIDDFIETSILSISDTYQSLPDFWLENLAQNNNLNFVFNLKKWSQEQQENEITKAKVNMEASYSPRKKQVNQIRNQNIVNILTELQEQIALKQENLKKGNLYLMPVGFAIKEKNQTNVGVERVKKDLIYELKTNQRFLTNDLHFLQEDGFLAMLPKNLDQLASKNEFTLTSETCASSYPFNSVELVDTNLPDFWGVDNNNETIAIDLFARTSSRKNSNMVILGKSGAGKSYFLSMIIATNTLYQRRIIIFDFEQAFKKLANGFNGDIIDVASVDSRINPLQIFVIQDADETGKDLKTNYVGNHILFLKNWFKAVFSSFTLTGEINESINSFEEDLLADLLRELYLDFEINNSNVGTKTVDQFPIFNDLYKLAIKKINLLLSTNKELSPSNRQKMLEYTKISRLLQRLTTIRWNEDTNDYQNEEGQFGRYFNGITTLRTISNLTVFDFYQMGDDVDKNWRYGTQMLLLNYVNAEIQKNDKMANNEILVFIDEAHKMLDKQQPFFLNFLARTYKQIRKKKGSIVIATQNPEDFLDDEETKKKTKAAINNSQYLAIFNLETSNIQQLQETIFNHSLNDSEVNSIIRAETGWCYLRISEKEKHFLKVAAEPWVKNLIELHAKKPENQGR